MLKTLVTTWAIAELDREYARVTGDLILGFVEAESKEEAEDKARKAGIRGNSGLWAYRIAKPEETL